MVTLLSFRVQIVLCRVLVEIRIRLQLPLGHVRPRVLQQLRRRLMPVERGQHDRRVAVGGGPVNVGAFHHQQPYHSIVPRLSGHHQRRQAVHLRAIHRRTHFEQRAHRRLMAGRARRHEGRPTVLQALVSICPMLNQHANDVIVRSRRCDDQRLHGTKGESAFQPSKLWAHVRS